MPGNDEKKNIIKAINKTGFPLELRVSKFLQEERYYVANNLYFIDQDEGKGREVEMRALKNYEFISGEKDYFIRYCLLIECKKSAKKPWVIFTSPKTVYDEYLFPLHIRGAKKDIKWEDYGVPDKMNEIHPFSLNERSGRSFFEPFSGGNERKTIYESLIKSVKATIAMRDNEFAAAASNSVCIYYPMVIFEGKLYEAYLDKKNKINVQEADSIMVSFFYESPKYKDERFIVPIVTEQYLQTFCSSLNSVLKFLGEFFKDNMSLIKAT